jgi:hypothetical protein
MSIVVAWKVEGGFRFDCVNGFGVWAAEECRCRMNFLELKFKIIKIHVRAAMSRT